MSDPVIIVDYDPRWVAVFEVLQDRLAKMLGSLPVTIEHIGSTSIPGAAAKPIIDIDVVVQSKRSVGRAIRLLTGAGYRHMGDLGIAGREAFENPAGSPEHHLYVVVSGNSEHTRHLLFRDYLRKHPDEVRKYSRLKRSLAAKFRKDREAYTEGKTEFVEKALVRARRPSRRNAQAAPLAPPETDKRSARRPAPDGP
jgi:GrpB-like predicted nucleotidyltransferase (UPF0157 family)